MVVVVVAVAVAVVVEEAAVEAVLTVLEEVEEVAAVVLQRQVQVSEAPSPEKLSSRNLPSVEETRTSLQESWSSHSPQPSQSGP